jgi:hypothetical protein
MSPVPGNQYPDRSIPFWDEADTITCEAAAAITGRRFVRVTPNTVNGHPRVAQCGLGQQAFGVSAYSADPATPQTELTVHRSVDILAPVEASGAIAAGQLVMSTANGRAIVFDAAAGHVAAGTCLFDVADGGDAVIDRAQRT